MTYVKENWTAEQITYQAIAKEKVISNSLLFYITAASSFLEGTVSLYTANLIRFFEGEKDIVQWLKEIWEPEELNHGNATREYLHTVWPGYDWGRAYAAFYEEYSKYCKVELLRPSKGLEMLARCITETGSSTFYRTIHEYCSEPVLKELMGRMARDEVRHYTNFYNNFRRFDKSEKNSLLRKATTIWSRTKLVAREDLGTSFNHINSGWQNGAPFPLQTYDALAVQLKEITQSYYPYNMARNMMFRALNSNHLVRKLVECVLETMARRQIKGF